MENMENKEVETVETVEAEVIEAPIVEEAPAKKKANVLAILALVAGILGIIFYCPIGCCYSIVPVFAIAAIILGFIAPKNENGKKNGMAIAGIICGFASLVLFVVNFIVAVILPLVVPGFGYAIEELLEEIMYF